MLDLFVSMGGNFIDTANIYGSSEEVLGEWLSKVKREDVVIATKVGGPMGAHINDCGAHRKGIMANVDRSLARMKTPYIDLYQVL